MNNYHKQNVVIIGGGPAGLGAALMLAKRGWKDIKVIEKRPSADYYEPDKSFSYQIDGRGQKLTDFLEITAKLADLSVPNTDFYFTIIQKDGTRKTTKLPIADSQRKTAYWLPRASFLDLLYQEIAQHWQDTIQILFNTECVEIKPHSQNLEQLEIITQSQNQEQLTFIPNLIVGCDGLNSLVRQTLHEIEGKSNLFAMQQFPSPSAGLKYKVLTLPAQFPLSAKEGDLSTSTMAYGIRSSFKGRKKAISLGLLPLKNPNQPRTANIINYPNHEIWQLSTPVEVEEFIKQAFPQLPIEKIISAEEIARFTASEGGKFPMPQYCSGLYQIFGKPENNQGTAVILLGDAVHCFPPDIGQGVNSALEDIYIFQEILQEKQDNLAAALPRYQNLRQNDIKALIRLVQISYPWQYNQDQLQKRLWSINFFLRLLLNRLFPILFSPHSFLLIQNHELSYSEILHKSNRTTQILSILGGLIILSLILMFTSSH
ncbi:NAD(P)/FAD-dependent oxidoreductase [Anabaena sp. UHCC 0451]|uniref:FAD-dependent oxidoreductase n=1 Tax=Anabaena sp. UHCC 0451 TaxID=2055235 RepID=UPI002B1F0CA9|nr:NAD(P)/FAD-dependent oxidoreductase [Anabaena sp. UHCC 0451]MEA5576270.1 NAD(P)/FAD-dependent oxidoreductase [Anabaena sp. UHCC 0451]